VAKPDDQPSKASEDELVANAFKPAKKDEVAAAIAKLTPEEAQLVLAKLEATFRKRRMQATGYIIAVVAWAVAMVCALAYDGATDGFVGWAYLVPFALVGAILWIVGKWSERIGRNIKPIPMPSKTDKPK
jgi:peptidoglycan/LPS O-acetylase OafA/YrhL